MNNFQSVELDKICLSLREGETQNPIIFFHPIGGSIISYYNFIFKMPTTYTIYGIQSPYLADIHIQPLETVNSMAEFYAHLIAKALSDVPLILIGWSYGGVLAYEVAKILKSKHFIIQSLIMIDACFAFPNHIRRYFQESVVNEEIVLRVFVQDILYSSGLTEINSNKFSISNFEDAISVLSSFNLVKQSGYHFFKQIYHAFKNNITCLLTYKLTSYDGSVNHILADTTVNNIILDPSLWESYVNGESKFFTVPGNHYSIMSKQNSKTLEVINNILNG